MKRFFVTSVFAVIINLCFALEPQDSLLLANAKWHTDVNTPKGIIFKQAQIEGLYGSVQSISLVEIPRSRKFQFGIAGNKGMRRTSQQASAHDALAAINGTYYNMRVGNSACFYKIDKEVIDSTVMGEFLGRVNGAIRERGGELRIIAWGKDIEQAYRGKRGTVLASGPLLIKNGDMVGWSEFDQNFINARHPRSALYVKRDGTTVFLTVDGRSRGNADGMSIPELAQVVKCLGAVDAINLDGGGSTTLWLQGLGVLNYPCDNRSFDHEGERSVSNIIYVK